MFRELLYQIMPGLLVAVGSILKYLYEKKKDDLKRENLELENERLRLVNAEMRKENCDYLVKLEFFNRVMDLPFINQVSLAVDRIFELTKADRFLIMVARNGRDDFNVVSVVFEQHKKKEYRINAIARYKNVIIDKEYKAMLKLSERTTTVSISTEDMEEGLLKNFYELEGVKHSKIRHLTRKPIDEDNDFLMYSSLSTHEDENFTRAELAFIQTQFDGTIKPALEQVMT